MEGHALAQTVAYGDLGTENPAVISAEYERQADLGVADVVRLGPISASLPGLFQESQSVS
jgi:hypothetical protein